MQFNVQSGGGEAYGGAAGAGGAALSTGSGSSGAHSPPAQSPPAQAQHALHAPPAPHAQHARLRAKEEDLSTHGRASVDGRWRPRCAPARRLACAGAADVRLVTVCAGGGSSDSEGEGAAGGRARAQYVSANCVVFTHYSGDVAAVVDEHFSRALSLDKPKGQWRPPPVFRSLRALSIWNQTF